MKQSLKCFIVLLFALIMHQGLNATHIIGGYWDYKCLGLRGGQVEYEIKLFLYKDCGPNANNINEDARCVLFDQFNNLVDSLILPRLSIDTIPSTINNPCLVSGPNLCVAEEIYIGLISLDTSSQFTLTYQRCCRNGATINNLFGASNQGITLTTTFPRFSDVGCNDSPVFNSFPPISLCFDFDLQLDLSASDNDGDSIVYSLCEPFQGGSPTDPIPSFRNVPPPPYVPVSYSAGFSSQNPMPANPALSINSQTGVLSGVPNQLGQFVVGFCLEEYRNGTLINVTRRDIQVNTGNCNPVIVSAVQDQQLFCDGLTVQFTNQSTANVNIQNFKWDFGDPSTLADTSRQTNPSYTYPDTGLYTITLISNPGLPCNDTSTKDFLVYRRLSPILTQEGRACQNGNLLNFVARGEYEPHASFEWDFGSDANIQTSTLDSVGGVVFSNGNNNFPVQLIVSQDGCSDTINQIVQLFENPIANFIYNDSAGCYPLPVQFINRSSFTGSADFLWNFGDGGTSAQFNPSHTYTANGYYDVQLELRTTSNCIDTSILTIDSAIHVSLDSSQNDIKFGVTPREICPGDTVRFLDSSFYEGRASYFWDFGDNNLSTLRNPAYIYTDTGYYDVGLLLITIDKCIDTLQFSIDSALRVLPAPVSRFTSDAPSKSLKEAKFLFDASSSEFATASNFFINSVFIENNDSLYYTFTDTGTFTISHIAENKFGCQDTSQQSVNVFDEFLFIIPNIFTPNGDLINDEFAVRACGVYEYEISIFNRYGYNVFNSESMNINWDGRINGNLAPDGIYYYKIRIKDFRGEYLNYTGNLTLVRN